MRKSLLIFWLLCGLTFLHGAEPLNADGRWFPTQKPPAQVYSTADASPSSVRLMLYQSLSGLAAKAVNEGRGDTMVWITRTNPESALWRGMYFRENPSVKDLGPLECWPLVEYFVKQGVVKGYILYSADKSGSGKKAAERSKDIDNSVNVACSMAGILGGIVVDKSLESEAKKAGLKMLADARTISQAQCFDKYKDKLNRDMMAVIDPRISGVRDLAVAHNCFVVFGFGEGVGDTTIQRAMEWLNPPAPILGWIGGDEFKATRLASVYGHYQTVSSLCTNLPVLMAGSESRTLPKVPHLDPKQIDWKDDRSTISYFMSDGDNAAWFVQSFFETTPYYWSNPDRGKILMNWTTPYAHLAQIAPQVIEYMAQTRTPNDWMVEWHGGYYYPDLFATERGEKRWDILAEHARRTWKMMQKTDNRIIGFNVRYWDSDDAKKAYETFAAQTDGLTAILAVQYSPYNKGAGEVIWVKDKRGVEIPVISLRYQNWWRLNKRPNTGTPMRVAREIVESIAQTPKAELPRHDWLMEHAWSYFQKGTPGDEDSQNLPDLKKGGAEAKNYEELGGVRGYTPLTWCDALLPDSVRRVTGEEMAWRLRMRHNPEQTKKLLGIAP